MDITDLILKDHQEQRHIFSVLEQVNKSETEQLSKIWKRARALLEVHAKAEEQFFYPTLLREGRGEGGMPDAKSETIDAIHDHNEIRDAIARTLIHAIGSQDWFEAISQVNKVNSDHMGEEERQGLTDFRQTVGLTKRHELAIQFVVFEAEFINGIVPNDIDPETYVEKQ